MPIPGDYILGPKDEVRILLYGGTSKQWDLTVSRDGVIHMPDYGPLSVAGQTFQEFKEGIQLIASNQFLNTQASVTMGELRSIGIFTRNPKFALINSQNQFKNTKVQEITK